MEVKLVSVTQSYVEGVQLSPEELLVYIARVSNPSNQLNTETADKLIRYMIKHKHWSPFDMVNFTVEVTTSRAIAHQILRHWSIKPQEFSQRYAEAVEFEPIELRRAGATNRQSSEEVFEPILWGDCVGFSESGNRAVNDYLKQGLSLYKELLRAGVAKECARFILPLCTSTTMYLNGSVRSWIHYLEQRTDQHAQKEHREVALEIKALFKQHFPNVLKAVEDAE